MTLTTSETRIVNKLSGGKDVPITVLFRLLRGRWPRADESNRRQQQSIGPTISRANKKLVKEDQVIVVGERRGTYRLIKI